MHDAEKAGREFGELVRILDVLRSEDGCPWDRQQDIKSIVNYFLEEAYEVVDSILAQDPAAVAEELGDMLMEIVFLARLYKETNAFRMSDVVEGINRKMIRRHPHVFGTETASHAGDVVATWNRQKSREKNRASLFDGIGSHTPALLTAFQIGLRAGMHGFDWPEIRGVLDKVMEEMDELETAVGVRDGKAGGEQDGKEVQEEIGDLFFALANLSRHLGINPELALRLANRKFIRRFRYVELKLQEQGRTVDDAALDEMETLWEESKKQIGGPDES